MCNGFLVFEMYDGSTTNDILETLLTGFVVLEREKTRGVHGVDLQHARLCCDLCNLHLQPRIGESQFVIPLPFSTNRKRRGKGAKYTARVSIPNERTTHGPTIPRSTTNAKSIP